MSGGAGEVFKISEEGRAGNCVDWMGPSLELRVGIWGPSLTLRVGVEGSSGEVVFSGVESEVVGMVAFVSREGVGEGLKLRGSLAVGTGG